MRNRATCVLSLHCIFNDPTYFCSLVALKAHIVNWLGLIKAIHEAVSESYIYISEAMGYHELIPQVKTKHFKVSDRLVLFYTVTITGCEM